MAAGALKHFFLTILKNYLTIAFLDQPETFKMFRTQTYVNVLKMIFLTNLKYILKI